MDLLRQAELHPEQAWLQRAQVARLSPAVLAGVCALCLVGLAWAGLCQPGPPWGWLALLPGAPILLMLCLSLSALRASFGPGRFVVSVDRSSLLINFRHFQNQHFPDDKPSAVRLSLREIKAARVVQIKLASIGQRGQTGEREEWFLDLELAHDETDRLARALRYENVRLSEGLISSRSGKPFLHLLAPDRLRVSWSGLSPDLEQFAEGLQELLPVSRESPAAREGDHFLEDSILHHLLAGNQIAAIKLLRRRYGFGTSRAVEFLAELSGQCVRAAGRRDGTDRYGRDASERRVLRERIRACALKRSRLNGLRWMRIRFPEMSLRKRYEVFRALMETSSSGPPAPGLRIIRG